MTARSLPAASDRPPTELSVRNVAVGRATTDVLFGLYRLHHERGLSTLADRELDRVAFERELSLASGDLPKFVVSLRGETIAWMCFKPFHRRSGYSCSQELYCGFISTEYQTMYLPQAVSHALAAAVHSGAEPCDNVVLLARCADQRLGDAIEKQGFLRVADVDELFGARPEGRVVMWICPRADACESAPRTGEL